MRFNRFLKQLVQQSAAGQRVETPAQGQCLDRVPVRNRLCIKPVGTSCQRFQRGDTNTLLGPCRALAETPAPGRVRPALGDGFREDRVDRGQLRRGKHRQVRRQPCTLLAIVVGQVNRLLERRAGNAIAGAFPPVLQVTLDPGAGGDFFALGIGFRYHPVHAVGGGVEQEKQ